VYKSYNPKKAQLDKKRNQTFKEAKKLPQHNTNKKSSYIPTKLLKII
jgi:hypothetical protein